MGFAGDHLTALCAVRGAADPLLPLAMPSAPSGSLPLEAFVHEATWIFYDMPLLFTACRDGIRYLVSFVDYVEHPEPSTLVLPTDGGSAHLRTSSSDWYLAAPISDAEVAALRAGTLAPRAFWTSRTPAECWVLVDGAGAAARPFTEAAIPDDWLPAADASYLDLMGDLPASVPSPAPAPEPPPAGTA